MKRPERLPLAGFLKNRRCAFASGADAASGFQRLNVQLAQRFAANSPKCQRYADAMRRLIQAKFR
jgi:hypothetical protein